MVVPQDLSRPINVFFVYLSLFIALLFNAIPWNVHYSNALPDFVALVLLYWGINQPHRSGLLQAFIFGLLVDVLIGTALGSHSLAYVTALYFVLLWQRQFEFYSGWQHVILVWLLMVLIQIINLLANVLLANGVFFNWPYLLSSATTAILWAPLSNLIFFLQNWSNKET